MPGDIERGSHTQLATPKKIWSKPKSFWPGAGVAVDNNSATSSSTDVVSRTRSNSERRMVPQDVETSVKRHSRRRKGEIAEMWRKHFSERVAAANSVMKNGKPFDCSGFLFLCWQDDSSIAEFYSAVAVPIPDTSAFNDVEIYHIIRDAWLETTGRWKTYSPFHRIRQVDFVQIFPSHINPAGYLCVGILGYASLGNALRYEIQHMTEGFQRYMHDPSSASEGEVRLFEGQFYETDYLMQQLLSGDAQFNAHFVREEFQFTRTWTALMLTTITIAITVIVGLKVVFPSWETTFAAGSYIASVITIPVMIFISRLEKDPSQIVGTASHQKWE